MRTFISWMKRNEHRYNVIHEVDFLLNKWRDMNDASALTEAIRLLKEQQ